MTLEAFESLMSGIQSLAATLAILGGGGWALYTFWALAQKNRAQAELQMLELGHVKAGAELRNLEIEIQKLEQEARIGAVIEMSITAKQQTLPDDSSRYVSAIVEIKNRGSRNAHLKYDETRDPFCVFPVRVEEDGSLKFEDEDRKRYRVPVSRFPNVASPSAIVRAGGCERIPFFFRVGRPGLYLLAFSVPLPQEEQDICRKLGFEFPGRWAAKEYFVVQ
ncbi:MAG TPA: hypothetical protein VJH03_24400 [Blastocatellia bacterium]|nr:hypothetical protein [Blastocatellia bacterium]